MIENKEGDKPLKRRLIVIKGQTVTKADYRALLALILVLTFAYVVISNGSCSAVAALGPLTGSAVTYYFQSKIQDSGARIQDSYLANAEALESKEAS